MDPASLARSIRLLLLSLVGIAAVAHAQACGSDDRLSSFVDDDAGRAIDPGDAFAGIDDAGPALGTLRLAHLAPELGTIDFCYGARTGALQGPVLRGGGVDRDAASDAAANVNVDASAEASSTADDDAAVDASAAPGLAYGTVTKYFTLQATGTIAVAIVRAGATTCASPLVEGTVTLDPGKLSTVGLFGSPPVDLDAGDGGDTGAPPIIAFIDDRATKPDRARVRMIHAANAGSLEVRAATTVIAAQLDPRKVTTASQTVPVDELGFATIVPVPPPAPIVVTPPDASSWQSAPVDLDLRGDSLHTGFVLDGPDGGFEILWCADRTTTAELTACSRLR
jgi:hypothetical protein